MGLTLREFHRTLPNAVFPYEISQVKGGYDLSNEERLVQIRLFELPMRTIAMLTIPACRVTFHSENMTEEEDEAFMTRFHRYFHRGGG